MKIVLGLLVMAVGLACFNYTSMGNEEHHVEWADEHGLPRPSAPIFFSGAAATVLGAGFVGFSLGRRRRA